MSGFTDKHHSLAGSSSVAIRPLRPVDAGPLYDALRESIDEVSPWLAGFRPETTLEDMIDFVSDQARLRCEGSAYNFAVVDASGRIVGAAGLTSLNRLHRFCNLYYWIRSSATGQGAAPAAVRLASTYAFEQLELVRVEIVVDVENVRSQRVAEKVGAKREGVARNRLSAHCEPHDAYMYSLIPADMTEAQTASLTRTIPASDRSSTSRGPTRHPGR